MATDENASAKSDSQSQVYAPSWINRFAAWVDRLPGPSWLYYLGIGLVLLLVQLVVLWSEGRFAIGTVFPIQVFQAVMMGFIPALIHYLDRRASAALATLRPLLKASDHEYAGLDQRLTTLPPWPTLLAGLAIFALAYLADEAIGMLVDRPDVFEAFAISPIAYWLSYVLYRLLWWLFGTLIYHTWHQSRQIHRIYTRHTRINLFRMGPLYAFSAVTALTAVGFVIPPYGFLALNPSLLQDLITVGYMLPITAVALAAFIWPLLGVHRLLGEEKGRWLGEAAQRFEAAIAELHRRMDDGKLEGMDGLNKAMACLEIERKALGGIPTWPWEPETVRLLITALALPLGLWIAQYVLQRALVP